MPKVRTLHTCQQCGYQSPKWLGRCPSCERWNTMVEELVESSRTLLSSTREAVRPTPLTEVTFEQTARIRTGVEEFDRVLGGGIVPSSVILVGGEPGIGKSTLLLTVAGRLANAEKTVLYVSGEESLQQIKLRAIRLGLGASAVHLLAHTQLEVIVEAIRQVAPDAVIVDSVQVIETDALQSAPGSIGQVRACAHELVRLVKRSGSALFLVGHVTKEGSLAGPKVLEHLVDTVLYFDGEPTTGLRLLRSTKNRFGATHELGVFHMTVEGLVEVSNPSEMFLSDRTDPVPGCMVTVNLEGSRPILAEVQALTAPCGIGLARRRTMGVDFNRVAMLLAVLERRVGLRQLGQQDVFVSSLGGVRLLEPAADLAISLAIASSMKDRRATRTDLAIGEVGLTGEVRPVTNLSQRLHEAKRVGFQRCLVAPSRSPLEMDGMEVVTVHNLREAVATALARDA